MTIAIIVFVISLIGLIFFSNIDKDKSSNKVLAMRKKQGINSFRENALKKKFEKMAEERAKVSKKYAVETNCLQAGFKLSYGEFKIISLSMAVILPIVMQMALNNTLLSLLFVVIGYMMPKEIIKFIKNRRVGIIDKQVGSFMQLTIERYKSQGDFVKAIEGCIDDLKTQEPMCSEIKQTLLDINLGVNTGEALDRLARRTGNRYLKRFADFYKITSDLGTKDAKENILSQAYQQYEENNELKSLLRKEIAGAKRDAYIMVGAVPLMLLYQAIVSDTYVDFMLNTTMGKIGTAVMITVILGSIWFINSKIAKPID